MVNIAIFASGNGSNAENIVKYFANNKDISVRVILSNNKDAYVHERARSFNIPSYAFSKKDFDESNVVLDVLKQYNIDVIVLAGFLLKISELILLSFPIIINIHPSLLPKFGGKGMYGDNVHREVLKSGDKESGITIHYVNKDYDKGEIIFQAKCKIDKFDNYEDLACKVHELEYKYFPSIIELTINKDFLLTK